MDTGKHTWSRTGAHIVLVLLSCVVALGLGEIIARVSGVADLHLTDPLFRISPAAGVSYEFKPNARGYIWGRTWVEINSRGLRGPDVNLEKPPCVFRIGVFGDSATFGQGVTDVESYPRVLERLLNERSAGSERVEVLNFAVPAYNITNIVSSFTEKGSRFALDIAIISPILDDYSFHRNHTADEYGYPVHASSPLEPGPLKNLLRQFHLAYVVRDAYWAITRMSINELEAARGTTGDTDLEHDTWQRAERELTRFFTRAQTLGTTPLYVAVESRLPSGLMLAIEQSGIPLVDIGPELDGLPKDSLRISSRDAHPSALLHRIVADKLSDILGESPDTACKETGS